MISKSLYPLRPARARSCGCPLLSYSMRWGQQSSRTSRSFPNTDVEVRASGLSQTGRACMTLLVELSVRQVDPVNVRRIQGVGRVSVRSRIRAAVSWLLSNAGLSICRVVMMYSEQQGARGPDMKAKSSSRELYKYTVHTGDASRIYMLILSHKDTCPARTSSHEWPILKPHTTSCRPHITSSPAALPPQAQ